MKFQVTPHGVMTPSHFPYRNQVQTYNKIGLKMTVVLVKFTVLSNLTKKKPKDTFKTKQKRKHQAICGTTSNL